MRLIKLLSLPGKMLKIGQYLAEIRTRIPGYRKFWNMVYNIKLLPVSTLH